MPKKTQLTILKNSLNFGSGKENKDGLQLKLTFDEDTRTVFGEYRCPAKFQGNETGNIHPGILALILDEIMAYINGSMNFDTYTGELTVRYLHSVKTKERLYLRGWFVNKNRRMVENRAEIENEIGKIVARGKGKYMEREEE